MKILEILDYSFKLTKKIFFMSEVFSWRLVLLKIDSLYKGKIVFYSETKVIFLFLFLILISVADIRFYKIPDSLLLSLFALLVSLDVKTDFNNILIHIASAILMFLIFFLIYKTVGGLGFGDVKFVGVLSYAMDFKISNVLPRAISSVLGHAIMYQ